MKIIFVSIFLSLFNTIVSFEKTYNLKNHTPQTFDLKKNNKYYFIIGASFLMTANVFIDMNSNNTQYLFIREVKNKNDISDFYFYHMYPLVSNDNYTLNPISYMTNSAPIKYLILKLQPVSDIYNFSIRIDLENSHYVLSNGTSKTFYDNSEIPKYFILKSEEIFISANFTFTTTSNNSFDLIKYWEISNEEYTFIENVYYTVKAPKIIKNNETKSYFVYNFTKMSKKYLIFQIVYSNLSYLHIKCDTHINTDFQIYDVFRIPKLIEGYNYTFNTYPRNKILNMTLSMENEKEFKRGSAFENLSIYEYLKTKTENTRLTGGKIVLLLISTKYNKIFYNCDSTIFYNITNNLLINFTVIRNITNFEIKIDFQEKYNYNNYIPSNKNSSQIPSQKSYRKKNKLLTISIIVIPIIIVILIIAIIIWYKWKRNKSHLDELNLEDNLDAPPAYSINDSENNNASGQPYFNNQQNPQPQPYQEYNGYSENNNSDMYMFPYDHPYAYRNNNQQLIPNEQNNYQY
jgi:hypothetical protein